MQRAAARPAAHQPHATAAAAAARSTGRQQQQRAAATATAQRARRAAAAHGDERGSGRKKIGLRRSNGWDGLHESQILEGGEEKNLPENV